MNQAELEKQARRARRSIVEMICKAKSSHIGCALGAADIMTALYFGGVMNVDPKDSQKKGRDRFVLSKGHAVTVLYSTLAHKGFFPIEKLDEYGTNGTELASHAVLGTLPGIENSAGSGGHGLPLGVGMALAERKEKSGAHVFVLSGDGESEEGSVWEGLLFASQYKLSNLTLIIDRNHLQDGVEEGLRTEHILDLDPLDEKLRAFGWDVDVVNGHDFNELIPVLKKRGDKPHAIIANTLKGKGVSFMENRGEWHGKCPDPEQYATAMKELSD